MKFFRILLFLFLLSFGSTILFLQFAEQGGFPANASITIQSGMSLQDVATTLRSHGLITSALAFRWYARSRDQDTVIQQGTVSIPRGASFAEILEILSHSATAEQRVTIPEGYTLAQIDTLLTKQGLIETGALITCARTCDFSTFDFLPDAPAISDVSSAIGTRLEGYLFPETYFVDPGDFVPKFFLERLLGTFRQRVAEEFASQISASQRSLSDLITMASLIERETSTDEERPIVAGILWKRLDAGQGLAVDATVRYALEKPVEPLTRTDLESDSPYNTRKFRGLPPGPIANPGMKSIRAALEPQESSYWYYLHGADGQIRYAETNDEHNANKARYL